MAQSQRDCIIQPKVASRSGELRWVCIDHCLNPAIPKGIAIIQHRWPDGGRAQAQRAYLGWPANKHRNPERVEPPNLWEPLNLNRPPPPSVSALFDNPQFPSPSPPAATRCRGPSAKSCRCRSLDHRHCPHRRHRQSEKGETPVRLKFVTQWLTVHKIGRDFCQVLRDKFIQAGRISFASKLMAF